MKTSSMTKKQLITAAIVAALVALVWSFWPVSPNAKTSEALKRHEAAVTATKEAEGKVSQAMAEVRKGWADTDAKLETARKEAYTAVSGMDVDQLVAGLRSELAIIRDERRNLGNAGRQRSNEPGGRGGNTTGVKSTTSRTEHINTGIAGRTRRDVAPDTDCGRIQATSTNGDGGVTDTYS